MKYGCIKTRSVNTQKMERKYIMQIVADRLLGNSRAKQAKSASILDKFLFTISKRPF